ncbi:MFS transporter [Frigoribacterium sp. CG_9.8]|uniref:MFS transporter n=1 Tax=Frigoribacterium sp. CG_9.8 TaxID=2787733 RepID=UPI0018C9414D|nr:MFS transporter [Frigoribacterium sp. CG_9.8]MBG6106925.1 DHA2 family multidrug resistance protein-like MFS transporter [Frigoribacterium sp. CG_9.8]
MTYPVPASTATPNRANSRQWTALVLLMLPVLLISVDNTVLSFALPEISRELRPSGTTLLWIVDIYPLVLAGLLVAMGTLGDRVGRRRLLLIGSTGFALISAAAAFAPTAELLVLARGMMGLFGAALMPSTLSLLRSIFLDPRQRTLAIAVWAGGFAAGSSLGPIVGGILLQHFAWGSVFLLAVPILIPLLVFGPWLIPESRDPQPGRIDYPSIVLSLLALAPLVFAVKSLSHDSITVVGVIALLVGAVSTVIFVLRQRRISNPLLDLELFAHGPFAGSVLANFLSVFSLVGFLFFISQHLQLVLGLEPLAAGLLLVPGAVVGIVAGLLAAVAVRRLARRAVIIIGLLTTTAGFVMIILLRNDLSALSVAIAFSVLSIGISTAETISNDTILGSVPPEKAGAASGISETAYELGAVLGTAVLGAILSAFYRANVVVPMLPSSADAAATGARETLGGAIALSETLPRATATPLIGSARAAFDSGVGATSAIAVVLLLVAVVVIHRSMRPVPVLPRESISGQ